MSDTCRWKSQVAKKYDMLSRCIIWKEGRLVVGWWSRGGSVAAKKPDLMRSVVTKASNRAAVHGVKLPIPDIIDKEEVEKEISKAKEMKERKRKQVEETVDYQLKQSSHDILFPPPDNPKI